MSWLLDTCVLSEYTRRQPHAGVMAWLDAQAETDLFISAVSLAELDKGILKLAAREAAQAPGARSVSLALWLARLRQRFEGRILPVDEAVWQQWARYSAEADSSGRPLSPMDGLIMATAHSRGLGVVTRNTADFAAYPRVFNPWDEAAP